MFHLKALQPGAFNTVNAGFKAFNLRLPALRSDTPPGSESYGIMETKSMTNEPLCRVLHQSGHVREEDAAGTYGHTGTFTSKQSGNGFKAPPLR